MSIKIGINGFGRIGRVITRILSTKKKFKIVLINEIDEDVNNLAYLLKYDSHYGKFNGSISADKKTIKINNNKIHITNITKIDSVPWKSKKVDILIDASGANSTLNSANRPYH